MKKILNRVKLFFAFGLALVFSLGGCYGYATYSMGNFTILKISRGEYAVTTYRWDGSEDGMRITLPDEYEDEKITRIGSEKMLYPFGVDFPDEYNGQSFYNNCVDIGDVSYTERLVFTVYVGKNIGILDSYVASGNIIYQTESGGFVKYNIDFYFECAEDNATFYSQNGKMYKKADNSLVVWDV